MSDTIITRFPPSPTGYLHVGGARTAIFNWLYARNQKGKFVLRIEDTDTERSTQAAVDAIFEGLDWLGIDWDEGPFYQTKRLPEYKEYLQKLIDNGSAYYCTCTPDEINAMREKAMAEGKKPRYDGTCRHKNLTDGPGTVIRIKAPQTGATVLHDVVKGDITLDNSELDDFIIRRSDGMPTYNFAVAIDDITMGCNVILRGDDHIMNTPKQMLIYNALNAPIPVFGHLPMVLGPDKTKLSKRHGAVSVTVYRDMGFLPEAMFNYLVRLGWSHGDQEFFTKDELIEVFDISHIGKSPGVFDVEKLKALNAEHIKAKKPAELIIPLRPFMEALGYDMQDDAFAAKVIETLQPRAKTLVEMAAAAAFYYADEVTFDEAGVAKTFTPDALPILEDACRRIAAAADLTQPTQEAFFTEMVTETGLKFGKIAGPLRLALTGKTASPGIFEIIEILGKDTVLKRLERAIGMFTA